MDEKQLRYEFLSVSGESHPGLTFEEYRDSCVFLLFYQYLCLKYEDKLEECYRPGALVRMAIRGKLQIPSFLRFIEAASPFIHLADRHFQLTEFSFFKNLQKVQLLEKQKSYARFFRKLIKKIDAWDCHELLLEEYPRLFGELMGTFARMKKETYFSGELLSLYRMFFSETVKKPEAVFLPNFEYGLLLQAMMKEGQKDIKISGFEEHIGYREIFEILCDMKGIPRSGMTICSKEEWRGDALFDSIGIFMPEGVEGGTLIEAERQPRLVAETAGSIAKGELPFLLSALSFLREGGTMVAVVPGALLYREGRESQLRRYIVEEKNYLDTAMLLPDGMFQSTGQKEVLLLFRKGRKKKDVLFFDCGETEEFGEEQLRSILLAWRERKTIPGFCSAVTQEVIEENEFNLNLPRYITKTTHLSKVDVEARKKRIKEIDRELLEIEEKILMYKRDLEM